MKRNTWFVLSIGFCWSSAAQTLRISVQICLICSTSHRLCFCWEAIIISWWYMNVDRGHVELEQHMSPTWQLKARAFCHFAVWFPCRGDTFVPATEPVRVCRRWGVRKLGRLGLVVAQLSLLAARLTVLVPGSRGGCSGTALCWFRGYRALQWARCRCIFQQQGAWCNPEHRSYSWKLWRRTKSCTRQGQQCVDLYGKETKGQL